MADVRLWDSRFAWSGEIPATFPGLNPVALNRVLNFADGEYLDAIDGSRVWRYVTDTGQGLYWGASPGPWGDKMQVNGLNPANEQGRVTLDHFGGLWPSSGRLLVGLWVSQNYAQSFNPLLDTRAVDPFIYLSSAQSSGRPRHQIYGADGSLLMDHYEDEPWAGSSAWRFVGVAVDLDAGTSQLFTVNRDEGASWAGPVRTFTGTPNTGSTSGLDVFSLRHAGYWEGGLLDEVLVAHPGPEFSVEDFADALARGSWARGQDEDSAPALSVTDSVVEAVAPAVLHTGPERMAWQYGAMVDVVPAGATPYLSTDDGQTWAAADPEDLPGAFDGLMRWDVPLESGETFDGLTVTLPGGPAPTLQPIAAVELVQGETQRVPLEFTGNGSWVVDAPDVVTAAVESGGVLALESGFEVGAGEVSVSLVDQYGRAAVRTVQVEVLPRGWDPPAPPVYPHAPLVLWDEDGPAEVLTDPLSAVITKEVNGEECLEFSIPATHKHAGLLLNERVVEAAGDKWWIRRVTTSRAGRQTRLEVYAEAAFYDLASAGQIDGRQWNGVAAGTVMRAALEGTGWTVGVANVSTRRTYETEDSNPLALLRTVQEVHGGDLVFDNRARTVSLVVQSGRDNGVAFFHSRGLTESKRVVDSTGLATRLWARNADGVGIESVNGGRPYVEDYSFTSEVKDAVYDFKAGTAPLTMLAMAQATLAKRSRPSYSYEVTVNDLSSVTGDELDRFDVGDRVTVVDPEVGIQAVSQRIVKLEYDVVRPWASEVTLSAKLRETGTASDSEDAGTLRTGSTVDTFDLVPFNLLRNGRFDNGLAHWANLGAAVVDSQDGTGDYAVRFEGSGERWIEQTVQPDNRPAYAFSMNLETDGPAGFVPDVTVEAVIEYEDGETETVELSIE